MELETHLRIVERMRLVPSDDVLRTIELSNRVGRLLNGLIRALRAPSLEDGKPPPKNESA
jgi:hypothetical protein